MDKQRENSALLIAACIVAAIVILEETFFRAETTIPLRRPSHRGFPPRRLVPLPRCLEGHKPARCVPVYISQPGRIVRVGVHEKAGLPQDLVLYCARHDFGTYVLNRTGNLKVVMQAMGHADVPTAMKYQHPSWRWCAR
jgi:integrase